MQTPNYRYSVILAVLTISIIILAGCKPKSADRQTEYVLKLAIHYLNTNNPDSFYQLTDQNFRKRVPPNLWASFYKQKLSTVMPIINFKFIKRNDSVSQYKADGKIPLNCYIG